MLKNLNANDYTSREDFEESIVCNEATIRIYECPTLGTCTILQSSSGWKYQLLNVIKTSIFGIVVRGQVVGVPSSSYTSKLLVRDDMVAIKMYSRRKIDEVDFGQLKEDPLAEISILQSFKEDHPNLLSQYECCADEENLYSIMPLLPGSELFDIVVDQGVLSELKAKVVFRQIVEGLQCLHMQGVAHQDISLENILYDSHSQRAVIIDFGLAIQCSHSGEMVTNNRAGKLFYMAPEVIGGNKMIDACASDIWSLGICLLYMLIGFPPIEYACDNDSRYQFVRDGRLPQLLKHWDIALSDHVLDLLQQLLQVNPLNRPSLESILSHSWLQEKSLSTEMSTIEASSPIFSFQQQQQQFPKSQKVA